ncbi:MAG: Crp/Fnr family transcriptional regulator [Proteobacteria bacterium]|nr:Crp/Fnr family transcriptional regulator [Pseudomonadota bacterium]
MLIKNRTAPPRSANAFAQTDTLASFDHKTFVDLLIKYPQLSWQINKRLVQIIRGLDVQMRDLTGLTPSQRVYMELLRLAGPEVKPDGTWGIRNMPNHKEIAAWAGTTPVTVARSIGRLARNGVVERHYKTLYINDYFRLRQLAQNVEEGGATGSRAANA